MDISGDFDAREFLEGLGNIDLKYPNKETIFR